MRFDEIIAHWKGVHGVARSMLLARPEAIAVTEETFRRADSFVADVPLQISLYRAAIGISLARLRVAPAKPTADPILGALRRLNPIDRAVFVLRDVEDLSAEEAAFILRTSPTIVRQRAHGARLVLTGCLSHLLGSPSAREEL
jgi:hypothetical protein